MKAKFLIAISLALILLSFTANAQMLTRKAKDSVVDAGTKYLTWTYTPSKVTTIVLTFAKGTGTAAATATLQFRADTIKQVWQNADSTFGSFAITGDSATYLWKVPLQYFNGIRIKVVGTGTQKIYLWAAYMRRPDD
jgi:hypothetical protein